MLSRRYRPLLLSAIAVCVIWLIAMTGFSLARNAKVTADKVQAYARSTDLSKLSGDARTKALRQMARMLNGLSLEERRKARIERTGLDWFQAMTEEERAWFVEETMPTGFKQMIASFEELPEESRKRTVDMALRRLREAQSEFAAGAGRPPPDTNVPTLSPELEARIRSIGLQAFYSQSSAQTKAELAPVLEELQRVMEGGRYLRHR